MFSFKDCYFFFPFYYRLVDINELILYISSTLSRSFFLSLMYDIMYMDHTSCVQMYELPQSHLTSVRFEHSVLHGSLIWPLIYYNVCMYICIIGSHIKHTFPNMFWHLVLTHLQYYSIYSKREGREVSKKSAFPTSFNLLTIFKGILWMWTSLENDQNLTSVFLCHVIWLKRVISKLQLKIGNKEQEIQLTGI